MHAERTRHAGKLSSALPRLAAALVACALVGAVVAPQPAVAEDVTQPLQATGQHFTDEHGRVRILHGVNVVYKRPPYLPSEDEFDEEDADLIASLGFNTVRLGFIWAGMQPQRGAVDDAYIDRYAELVDMLTARGIYVLIDSHQDVYNEQFAGEGAPDWAVITNGIPFFPGLPMWGMNYVLQPAVWWAYQSFWDNRGGIQDEYVAMWQEVAARFADNPRVLGYDLMNEPWPGVAWWSWAVDSRTLEPFYRRTAAAVRAVDPGHTIFWEPALSTQLIGKTTISSIAVPNTALSYHIYCALTILRIFVPGTPYFECLCDWLSRPAFVRAREDRKRTGSAWLLTEFGATDIDRDVALHARLADDFLSGWQYWAWKLYDDPTGDPDEALVKADTGELQLKSKVEVLERTYARAIAGAPERQSFDPNTGDFHLRYVPDHAIGAPTEIWVPTQRHYPGGYEVAVYGGVAVRSPDGHEVFVTADAGADEVTVHITKG